MKTLVQIFIVAMFGIEICSPFLIGYLNKKAKQQKVYAERKAENINLPKKTSEIKQTKNWKAVDYSENSYSDSKSLSIKE